MTTEDVTITHCSSVHDVQQLPTAVLIVKRITMSNIEWSASVSITIPVVNNHKLTGIFLHNRSSLAIVAHITQSRQLYRSSSEHSERFTLYSLAEQKKKGKLLEYCCDFHQLHEQNLNYCTRLLSVSVSFASREASFDACSMHHAKCMLLKWFRSLNIGPN